MANYSYGSTGAGVAELQKMLNGAGYQLDTDGIYGDKTQAAVKDYQTKNKLTVDGIAGSQTLGALGGTQQTAQTTTGATTPTATNAAQTATQQATQPAAQQATPGTDWSVLINQAVSDGASAEYVQWLNDQRNKKIAGDHEKYGKYAGDATATAADQYVTQNSTSFDAWLKQNGYDQYSDATRAAIDAAVQKAILGYEGQITDVNQQAEQAARQAYIAKKIGQKNLDQELAYEGYAGGMADSQKIAIENQYLTNLNDLETERQAAVREIQSAIEAARLDGDLQTATELQSFLTSLQSSYQSSRDNAKSYAYQTAMTMLELGMVPDENTLATAGLSLADAQSMASGFAGTTVGTGGTTPAAAPTDDISVNNKGGGSWFNWNADRPTATPAATPATGANVSGLVAGYEAQLGMGVSADAVEQKILDQVNKGTISAAEGAQILAQLGFI